MIVWLTVCNDRAGLGRVVANDHRLHQTDGKSLVVIASRVMAVYCSPGAATTLSNIYIDIYIYFNIYFQISWPSVELFKDAGRVIDLIWAQPWVFA